MTLHLGHREDCELSGGRMFFPKAKMLDGLHFLSAGMVSFARGLNDAPKIAAVALIGGGLSVQGGILVVAVAMACGGLLHARGVAETMAHKVTRMSPGEGLAANMATAMLVLMASRFGLPVSTTHVSVGSLVGIGTVTGKGNPSMILTILASWVITLPLAMFLGAMYWMVIPV